MWRMPTSASPATRPIRLLLSQFERFPWEEDSLGNPISRQGRAAHHAARNRSTRSTSRRSRSCPSHSASSATGAKTSTATASTALSSTPALRPAFLSGTPTRRSATRSSTSTASPTKSCSTRSSLMPIHRRTSIASRSTMSWKMTRSKTSAAACSSRRSAAFCPAYTTFPVRRRSSIRSSIRGSSPSAPVCKTGSLRPPAKSPTTSLALRLGMHHRLQTKHGPPGEERIVDWITFDANATVFPDADRDNFGQQVGLLDYDFHWFLGDRFSILSDGYADTFGDGLKTASIGLLINRPRTGNFYLGFRAATGPVRGGRRHRYRQLPHEPRSGSARSARASTSAPPVTSARTSGSHASANRCSPRSARQSTRRKAPSALTS